MLKQKKCVRRGVLVVSLLECDLCGPGSHPVFVGKALYVYGCSFHIYKNLGEPSP